MKTCECGCGQPVSIVAVNDRRRGLVKGEPRRFVNGHNRTRRQISPDDYRVEDRGFITPCWIWLGSLTPKGYGHLTIRGRSATAHRAMWEQERGRVPDGLQLDHLCAVRSCCNPSHLEPVTPLTNVRRSRRTKIPDEAVAAIRAARESGERLATIADRFSVSTSQVHNIVTGKQRAALPDAASAP